MGEAGQRDVDLAYVEAAYGEGSGAAADELDAMVMFSVLRTSQCLGPQLEAELRKVELTAAQFNALLLLRSAGEGGMLMGEVGQRLVVTKSNVTGLVDRLERAGLAARMDHTDRRATVVRITGAGEAMLDRVMPGQAAVAGELAGSLVAWEKRMLVELLRKLRRGLRERRGG
ncbi:MAG: MarR family transcriptional regulator [Phycisphaeraceae bacterium]|nr:MarR family transcriptional regulator [Phycisphaeraceae bacterium]